MGTTGRRFTPHTGVLIGEFSGFKGTQYRSSLYHITVNRRKPFHLSLQPEFCRQLLSLAGGAVCACVCLSETNAIAVSEQLGFNCYNHITFT